MEILHFETGDWKDISATNMKKKRRYAFKNTHIYIYMCFLTNHEPYRSNPSLSTRTGSPTRYLFGSTLPRIAVYITSVDVPSLV